MPSFFQAPPFSRITLPRSFSRNMVSQRCSTGMAERKKARGEEGTVSVSQLPRAASPPA